MPLRPTIQSTSRIRAAFPLTSRRTSVIAIAPCLTRRPRQAHREEKSCQALDGKIKELDEKFGEAGPETSLAARLIHSLSSDEKALFSRHNKRVSDLKSKRERYRHEYLRRNPTPPTKNTLEPLPRTQSSP